MKWKALVAAATQATGSLRRLSRPDAAHSIALHPEQVAAILDGFFELAPVGLVVLDRDMRFLMFNRALPRTTEREPQDYIGHSIEELPNMPPEALAAVQAVVRTREVQAGVEISRQKHDGSYGHWVITYFPIELPGGDFLIGGIVQDISGQRDAEHQRSEALAAAEEANRAKDRFLARVSHELRSPLQVALSSAEVLKRLPDLPPQARKFVDRMAHAVSMQARMINDLVDVSRILSGKLHIANENVDPALPLLRVLENWSATAQERGIAMEWGSVRPGRAMVEADPARLEQVYANLIDNAIRFSQAGGRVQVGAFASPTHWRLSVRDFGAGMAANEVRRVFEPFAQGSSQPRTGKGLGLGLAIVKSLVDAFGGRVWAESAGLGRGSTFIVELPLLPIDSEPSSEFGAVAGAPRLDGLNILYVDDEVEVAIAMQDGLRSLGAHVETAFDYPQACQWLDRMPLDVLVTDLNLGSGPGGADIAEFLHRMPRHALVPAIAVSAFGGLQDIAATRRAGFAAHLVKPVDMGTVAQLIRQVAAR